MKQRSVSQAEFIKFKNSALAHHKVLKERVDNLEAIVYDQKDIINQLKRQLNKEAAKNKELHDSNTTRFLELEDAVDWPLYETCPLKNSWLIMMV